jgi:membrane protein DedA with SNARE-associated domain
MKVARFHVYTFAGSLPWCWALAYAGMKLGERYTLLREYFHRFDLVLAILVVLGAVWFVRSRWKNRIDSP